jgi:hypothetical protein
LKPKDKEPKRDPRKEVKVTPAFEVKVNGGRTVIVPREDHEETTDRIWRIIDRQRR